ASYVKLSGRLTQDRVRPGDKFQAQLVIDVNSGYHIQSSTPLDEGLIATQVYIEPVKDLELSKPIYPRGKERSDPALGGKLSEYAGQVVIGLPMEAAETLSGERKQIRGVLKYQACDDKTCFPPEDVQFAIDVPVAKA